jgi:tRNA dimethylallyltransferase
VVVVGATATGKSALAVGIAQAIGGEVVNADASQLYRGMDIGTGKLPVEERGGVRHHLLDIADVSETVTVAAFQRQAQSVLAELAARQVPAVLVGGSALHVRAVLDRFEIPGTDPAVRAALEHRLAEEGPAALHAALAGLDPAAAAHILPSNGRRLVRALEVVTTTGRPFQAVLPPPRPLEPDEAVLGLRLPRPELDRRIQARVAAMLAAGFLEEVRRLSEHAGLRRDSTAARALGYAQLLDHLDGGCSLVEAVDATVAATRRFSRRQDSWFRRDPRIRWLDADRPAVLPEALAALTVPTIGVVSDAPGAP